MTQPYARPWVHTLYIASEDKGVTGRQAAGYVGGVADQLGQLGIAIEIYRIRPKDLRNRRVLDALRRRGIDRLPAVLADGRPVVGLSNICDYYETQLRRPPPAQSRGFRLRPAGWTDGLAAREVAGGEPSGRFADGEVPDDEAPEAILEDYFREQMKAGGDREDDGLDDA